MKNKETNDNIIYSYKKRKIDYNKPVLLYKNLHKNMYSIKQNNLVVAHALRLCLTNVHFIVNEKGRQKVIETKQKNVHAFIKGFVKGSCMGTTAKRNDLPVTVYYNPYKTKTFINKSYNKPLKGALAVIADENSVKASYTY